MAILNFEFKAKAMDTKQLENKLLRLNPRFIGLDHQTDTYFNVNKGRLKLREGNIENSLIYYERKDTADTKQSDILLYTHNPDKVLKEILIQVHGIKVIVDKKRKIYFIENVKFHFDEVKDLGEFIEVEAIDTDGKIGAEKLQGQCNYYMHFFGITKEDCIAFSYSDLVLESHDL